MVNKKGFIRTLEAVIAIILILGFIFYITPRVVEFEEKVPENVANAKEFILNQILLNKDYGACIASVKDENKGECKPALGNINIPHTTPQKKCDEIIKLMDSNIPVGYGYACEICLSSPSCISLETLYPGSKGK